MQWTHEEETTALAMRKDGATYVDIADSLPGRTPKQVGNYFARRAGAMPTKNSVAVEILRSQFTVYAPREVLLDRDRRLNADLTIDMIVNGTPRPGQSALDRLKAATANAALILALIIGAFASPAHAGQRGVTSDNSSITAHPAGCPRVQFCGCGVSVRVYGHPVRDLYLARNWFRFARAGAAPGNVAIFRHGGHVAYIESMNADGSAVLYDPNSGNHLTRIHSGSLAGATIVSPRG